MSASWTERWRFASTSETVADKRVDPRAALPAELLRRIVELCDQQTRRNFRRTCKLFRACGNHPSLFPRRLLATVDIPLENLSSARLGYNRREAVREVMLGHRRLVTSCGHGDCDLQSAAAIIRHGSLITPAYERAIALVMRNCPNVAAIVASVCLLESAAVLQRITNETTSAKVTRLELIDGCGRYLSRESITLFRNLEYLAITGFCGMAGDWTGKPCLSSVRRLDLDTDTALEYQVTVTDFVTHCSQLEVFRLRAPLEHSPFRFLAHLVCPTLSYFEFCGKTHQPETDTSVLGIRSPYLVLQQSNGAFDQILWQPETEFYTWKNANYTKGAECRRLHRVNGASVPAKCHLTDSKNYSHEEVPFPPQFLADRGWYAPRFTQQQCLGLTRAPLPDPPSESIWTKGCNWLVGH